VDPVNAIVIVKLILYSNYKLLNALELYVSVDSSFRHIHCFLDFGQNYRKTFFRDSYRAIRDVIPRVNLSC